MVFNFRKPLLYDDKITCDETWNKFRSTVPSQPMGQITWELPTPAVFRHIVHFFCKLTVNATCNQQWQNNRFSSPLIFELSFRLIFSNLNNFYSLRFGVGCLNYERCPYDHNRQHETISAFSNFLYTLTRKWRACYQNNVLLDEVAH